MTEEARFCFSCGSALEATQPCTSETESGGAHSVDAAPHGFIGREVAGRFRILDRIAYGGIAVFRAEQISLKRIVTLKVLSPGLSASPDMVSRFNAEAEVAAMLSHPNIVTLYDLGQDSDGCPFIAMEYLEAPSLREVLAREGALAQGRAVGICEQLCAALAHAHAHGVMHQQLHPSNVMLIERERQTDVVRVLDFGVPITRDGAVFAVMGKPEYMAPEQLRFEPVDARSNIYALGAMLYEMVTGRRVFEAAEPTAILSKHQTDEPVPPHERRPDLRIAPALSQLITNALHKDPAQRPPSMLAFADRLKRAS